MKIADAIPPFVDYITVERRLAKGTIANYVSDVERFAAFLKARGVEDLEQVESLDVREWQMGFMEAGEAAGTVKGYLVSLRSWFKFLRRQKLMDRDIMAKITPPKAPKRLPVFFREIEAERIYEANVFPNTFEGERDKLVLRMLYETGMRRSELAYLTLAGVDLSAPSIKVLGKRSKERIIPIENELAQNINRYLALREEAIGRRLSEHPEEEATDRLLVSKEGRGISDGKIYSIVNRYMSRISTADRTSPHVFRHSFATHMLNEGANIDAIKELLGHASLSTTEIYTHVTREHLKEAYRHAHPRALPKRDEKDH